MYSYNYDQANRLTDAAYSSVGSVLNENYSVTRILYDRNGNIRNFDQSGLASYTTTANQLQANFGAIDILTYGYEGNRLIKADDNLSVSAGTGDFKNGINLATEYTYDDIDATTYGNGNLTSDLNKNISSIVYNHLNLPERINLNSAGTTYILYIYTATGVKLRRESYLAGSFNNKHDYAGGFVYEREKLEFFPTEEGRAIAPYFAQSASANFVYEYHYKDHQGNLRLSFLQPKPTVTFMAIMEDVNAPTEDAQFANVAFTRVNEKDIE